MNILVTNDDGIRATGLERLARMASKFGDVTVVAPLSQCSAMSQKLTIMSSLHIVSVPDYPVKEVKAAYLVDGTPADCVKCGISTLMDKKPDIVFSGINAGYNSGFDIAYSGTVGAAMESTMSGIPAIAFSTDYFNCTYAVVDKYISSVTGRLLDYTFGTSFSTDDQLLSGLGDSFMPEDHKLAFNEIWNVNFPECALSELKGIAYDTRIAMHSFYENDYNCMYRDDHEIYFRILPRKIDSSTPGTDIDAIRNDMISVGKVKCSVMCGDR